MICNLKKKKKYLYLYNILLHLKTIQNKKITYKKNSSKYILMNDNDINFFLMFVVLCCLDAIYIIYYITLYIYIYI